jgi:hypothetical protein
MRLGFDLHDGPIQDVLGKNEKHSRLVREHRTSRLGPSVGRTRRPCRRVKSPTYICQYLIYIKGHRSSWIYILYIVYQILTRRPADAMMPAPGTGRGPSWTSSFPRPWLWRLLPRSRV